MLIDSAHLADLLTSLCKICLVDADSINPDELDSIIPQLKEGVFNVRCDFKPSSIQQDIFNVGRGAPCVGKRFVGRMTV